MSTDLIRHFRLSADPFAPGPDAPPGPGRLTPADAEAFVAERLRTAGGAPDLFAPRAVETIWRAAEGDADRLRWLAGLAMAEAALDDSPAVVALHPRVAAKRAGLEPGAGPVDAGAAAPAAAAAAAPLARGHNVAAAPVPPRQSPPVVRRSVEAEPIPSAADERIERAPVKRRSNAFIAGLAVAGLAAAGAVAFIAPVFRDSPEAQRTAPSRTPAAGQATVERAAPPESGMDERATPDLAAAGAPQAAPAPPPRDMLPDTDRPVDASRTAEPDAMVSPASAPELADAPSRREQRAERVTAADNADQAVRVFVHYAPGDRAEAEAAADALTARGWRVAALREVDRSVRAPDARFYYAGDARAADRVGQALAGVTGRPTRVRNFGDFPAPPRAGTIEVWLPARG